MFRIGNGYDVHRLVKGRRIILGGIHIPYEKGLLGHSDADVLTHAVMDSLLGACALKDIGWLFPDTDTKYKDADSMKLLKHVYEVVKFKGYVLSNLDSVIIAQKPKLSPYIDDMRASIANVLNTDINNVSVKATTEEGLGFTGQGEAMAAHAVCLLVQKGVDYEAL